MSLRSWLADNGWLGPVRRPDPVPAGRLVTCEVPPPDLLHASSTGDRFYRQTVGEVMIVEIERARLRRLGQLCANAATGYPLTAAMRAEFADLAAWARHEVDA